MLTIRELIKTLYNAFNQKLKNHRGNWEQNDPTADDYVKNRPFYSGELVETELFSTTITSYVQYQDGMGIAQLSLDKEVVLTEGETYKVIWNGVEYETVAWNLDGTPGIGDKSMIDSSTSTGEPFLIGLPGDMGVVYAFDLTSETDARTISILGFVQEIIKIPEKYLPDYIASEDVATSLADTAEHLPTVGAIQAELGDPIVFEWTAANPNKGVKCNKTYNEIVEYVNKLHTLGAYNTQKYYKDIVLMQKNNGNVSMYAGVVPVCNNIHVDSSNNYRFTFIDINRYDAKYIEITYSEDGNITAAYSREIFLPAMEDGKQFIIVKDGAISPSWVDSFNPVIPSSTARSTKKYKITVDDNGIPTLTDTDDSTNTWTPDYISTPTTASIGQTIIVKSVDENGKPTEWEAADVVTEDRVNELIDAKIAAIPAAEEASF